MERYFLEIAQVLREHPILREPDAYKIKYLNMLEYFVRKYSHDDLWANSAMQLYTRKLLSSEAVYSFNGFDLPRQSKEVLATKFRPFHFFTYRYCLVFDCIFINACDNQDKGEQILTELASVYRKPHAKKLWHVFEFLFDASVTLEDTTESRRLLANWDQSGERYARKIREQAERAYDAAAIRLNSTQPMQRWKDGWKRVWIRFRERCKQLSELLRDSRNVLLDDFDQTRHMSVWWNINRDFLSEEPVKVLITANMSAGKSTLLNAIVGKKVNRTQNEACTAKIHYIVSKPFEDGLCGEWDYALELDADERTLMEDNEGNLQSEITVGTYFRGPERRRIWLIDTPGVNASQNIEHKRMTEELICSTDVDAVICLLNGENIGTDDDKKHLMFLSRNYHGHIFFAVNKLDRFRKNEDSVPETLKLVVEDLERLGFENPFVVPVSAYAAYLAKQSLYGGMIDGRMLDEDEEDEFQRMLRKLRKPEYQFDTYYPEAVRQAVRTDIRDERAQLLFHSGILQLENIIYNLRR